MQNSQRRKIIELSGLFEADWYLTEYDDVRDAGVDPIEHYIYNGWKEGRSPSYFFDSKDYLARYGHLLGDIENPLLHYLVKGREQGLVINCVTR